MAPNKVAAISSFLGLFSKGKNARPNSRAGEQKRDESKKAKSNELVADDFAEMEIIEILPDGSKRKVKLGSMTQTETKVDADKGEAENSSEVSTKIENADLRIEEGTEIKKQSEGIETEQHLQVDELIHSTESVVDENRKLILADVANKEVSDNLTMAESDSKTVRTAEEMERTFEDTRSRNETTEDSCHRENADYSTNIDIDNEIHMMTAILEEVSTKNEEFGIATKEEDIDHPKSAEVNDAEEFFIMKNMHDTRFLSSREIGKTNLLQFNEDISDNEHVYSVTLSDKPFGDLFEPVETVEIAENKGLETIFEQDDESIQSEDEEVSKEPTKKKIPDSRDEVTLTTKENLVEEQIFPEQTSEILNSEEHWKTEDMEDNLGRGIGRQNSDIDNDKVNHIAEEFVKGTFCTAENGIANTYDKNEKIQDFFESQTCGQQAQEKLLSGILLMN